ncbi:hypothetical protein [Pseudomonas sp.]|uniref:hypothetical protein n=1 Tax=Pseudomonas sp. TaxID=306 RepID=UPI003265E3B9
MSNISIITPSRATFAPAIALALYGLTAQAHPVQPPAPSFAKYETTSSKSSAQGTFSVWATEDSIPFDKRLTSFYAKLASSQQELGAELESLMLANLSDLYEE